MNFIKFFIKFSVFVVLLSLRFSVIDGLRYTFVRGMISNCAIDYSKTFAHFDMIDAHTMPQHDQ